MLSNAHPYYFDATDNILVLFDYNILFLDAYRIHFIGFLPLPKEFMEKTTLNQLIVEALKNLSQNYRYIFKSGFLVLDAAFNFSKNPVKWAR